jgi:hypothetical protein
LTVFKTNETTVTAGTLRELTASYDSDDVWTIDFLESLAILMPSDAVLADDVATWMQSNGVKYLLLSDNSGPKKLGETGVNVLVMSEFSKLRPGPYTLSVSQAQLAIYEAYRLHRDQFEAFLFGVTPQPNSSAYAPVDLMLSPYQDAWIPVPSKLYWLGDDRPMAGIRVALKDIYDLEGVKTGGGSRSYTEVYEAPNVTALSIEMLLDMGAVIIVRDPSTH